MLNFCPKTSRQHGNPKSLESSLIMVAYRNNYPYSPTPAAAVICLVGFTVITGWHMFVAIRRRTWYFTPLVCGGIRMCCPSTPFASSEH